MDGLVVAQPARLDRVFATARAVSRVRAILDRQVEHQREIRRGQAPPTQMRSKRLDMFLADDRQPPPDRRASNRRKRSQITQLAALKRCGRINCARDDRAAQHRTAASQPLPPPADSVGGVQDQAFRIASAPGVPPGSRVRTPQATRSESVCASAAARVDLPTPSPPSSVMKRHARPIVLARRLPRQATQPHHRLAEEAELVDRLARRNRDPLLCARARRRQHELADNVAFLDRRHQRRLVDRPRP